MSKFGKSILITVMSSIQNSGFLWAYRAYSLQASYEVETLLVGPIGKAWNKAKWILSCFHVSLSVHFPSLFATLVLRDCPNAIFRILMKGNSIHSSQFSLFAFSLPFSPQLVTLVLHFSIFQFSFAFPTFFQGSLGTKSGNWEWKLYPTISVRSGAFSRISTTNLLWHSSFEFLNKDHSGMSTVV